MIKMIPRNVYRLRVYVGPCSTDVVAHKLRIAGFADVLAGTEDVHFDAPAMDSDPYGACGDATSGWGALGAQADAAEAIGFEWFARADSSIIRKYTRSFPIEID